MREVFLLTAITFIILIVLDVFLKKNLIKFLPISIICLSLVLPIFSSMGLRIREVVEGPFAYFDIILSIILANTFAFILFNKKFYEQKLINILNSNSSSFLKALKINLLVGLPSLISGIYNSSLDTTIKAYDKIIINESNIKDEVFNNFKISAFINMIAPPLCLPAMIIFVSRSGSYPTTFEGLFILLLIIFIPAILIHSYCSKDIYSAIEVGLINQDDSKNVKLNSIVILIISLLIIGHNFLYRFIPFLGYPLIFIIGIILMILISNNKKVLLKTIKESVKSSSFIIALFISGGSLLEILTMTGVSGTISTILADWNLTIIALIAVTLVLLAGKFIGIGTSIALSLLSSYVYGAISWSGTSILLLSLGVMTCLGFLFNNEYETETNRSRFKLKNINISIVYIILISYIYIILGSNLEILMN